MHRIVFLAARNAVQKIEARLTGERAHLVLWRGARNFMAHAARGVARRFFDGTWFVACLVFAIDNDGVVIGGAAKLYAPVHLARLAIGITAGIDNQ